MRAKKRDELLGSVLRPPLRDHLAGIEYSQQGRRAAAL